MQKFNTNNVESRFIKNLLLNTYLPNFPIAYSGDTIKAGATYTFGNNIIKCLTSGALLDSSHEYKDITFVEGHNSDETRFSTHSPACGDSIVCGESVICGVGMRIAEYTILTDFTVNKQIPGLTSNFISHLNTYGEEAHKQLGKYLRWYKSAYDIDLMPLYNCFTNTETTHIHLNSSGIVDGNNPNVTTWIIPALPNKKYQIYINEPGRIFLGATFLNELGRVKCRHLDVDYLDEILDNNLMMIEGSSYSRPIEFSVSTDDPVLINYSNNFYIVLQVSKNHTSSIAVIESDATSTSVPITSREIFVDRKDKKWKNIQYHQFNPLINSSLTNVSTSYSIPYSDRLIEYLLNNVIDTREDISMNIYRLQKELGVLDKYDLDKDVWSPLMKFLLHNKYFQRQPLYYVENNQLDLANIPDTKLVKDDENNIVGLKNVPIKKPHYQATDIVGFCDKDVENSIFRYEGV